MPRFTTNNTDITSSQEDGRQKVPTGSQIMPPPPNKVGNTPRKRDSGPKLLDEIKDTSSRRPSIDSGRSKGPRPDVSRPDTVVSRACEEMRPLSRQLNSGSDSSDRRRYRDREYGIQELQYRRSDSPDRHREPRSQDRDRDYHGNTGSSDDRSDRKSIVGSSNSSNRLPGKPARTGHKLPDKPPVVQPVGKAQKKRRSRRNGQSTRRAINSPSRQVMIYIAKDDGERDGSRQETRSRGMLGKVFLLI